MALSCGQLAVFGPNLVFGHLGHHVALFCMPKSERLDPKGALTIYLGPPLVPFARHLQQLAFWALCWLAEGGSGTAWVSLGFFWPILPPESLFGAVLGIQAVTSWHQGRSLGPKLGPQCLH